MMSEVVLRAEKIGKKYLVGHRVESERYVALRDSIGRGVRRVVRAASEMIRARQYVTSHKVEEFWALKDVSFEVKRGEVVGIIGRNGAGKSTLLKILSRITEPSEGRVEIRGRVASLLEVGTGFHPELTGRENVFLNGALLGMKHNEIKRKFDEIVEFAGVGRFIDTPVKRHSSGMQVRLAFSVAAHLEAEILLVDEILAVGDAEFQKKCLGKVGEIVGQGGRTVLFVSHQMGLVTRLCGRGILMSEGSVAFNGSTTGAIDKYSETRSAGASYITSERHVPTPGAAFIQMAEVVDENGTVADTFPVKSSINLNVTIIAPELSPRMILVAAIENSNGLRVACWYTRLSTHASQIQATLRLVLTIAPGHLAPGQYSFLISVFEPGAIHHRIDNVCEITVVDADGALSEFGNVDYGCAFVPGGWQIKHDWPSEM